MIPEKDAYSLADDISSRLGYLDIVIASAAPPLPWSCQALLTAQERGEDPTFEWRRHVGQRQTAYYRTSAPPSVASAFVFQWYLGVVSLPLAFAATLRPWVIDGSPDALRFDLSDDEWFPCAVSINPGRVAVVGSTRQATAAARQAYLAHAQRFADSYRTEVKMSSRQRQGMVLDSWWMALRSATAGVTTNPVEPKRRQSCCFIFALPGAQPCVTCPRLTPYGA